MPPKTLIYLNKFLYIPEHSHMMLTGEVTYKLKIPYLRILLLSNTLYKTELHLNPTNFK